MSGDGKDFTLSLDDDVLAAAMASVDKHLGHVRKRRAYDVTKDPEEQPELQSGPDHEPVDVDVELELDDLDEGAESIEVDLEESAAPLVNQEALALLARNEELQATNEQLYREIEMLRTTLARQQTDLKEQKERAVRLNVRGKRLHTQHETLALRHADAQAKLEEWETQLHDLREALRQTERERAQRAARFQRESDEAQFKTRERTLRELLPAVDNLELAMVHADNTAGDQMVAGVKMILRQLEQAFQRIGLVKVESTPGTPFDPTCHEAVKHVPTDEQEAGTVFITHQVGWRLQDRLLRAARVEVADRPRDESPIDPSNEASPVSPTTAEEE